MPRAGDARFQPSHTDPEPQGLGYERRISEARRRRLEREVFDSATRNLDSPLLRPRTGTPLRPGEHSDPHRPNVSTAGRLNGGPVVLPPVTFTPEELDEF